MEIHHKNKFEKHLFMNLGTETNLQSQRHTRGKQLKDKVSDPCFDRMWNYLGTYSGIVRTFEVMASIGSLIN